VLQVNRALPPGKGELSMVALSMVALSMVALSMVQLSTVALSKGELNTLALPRPRASLPDSRLCGRLFLLAPIWLRNWANKLRARRCPGRLRPRAPVFRYGLSRLAPASLFIKVRPVPAQHPWQAAALADVRPCPDSAPAVRGRCIPLRVGA